MHGFATSKTFLRMACVALVMLVSSCGLFKKKCDCPDLRRSKRIAKTTTKSPIVASQEHNLFYLRRVV
jgi:hypothetical protein